MSRVDVVVPCYNYGRFLQRCVDSLLSQQGVDVRVLIIDDASADDTLRVGQRLAALDSRVAFRRHDVNQGHIATYNEGLLGWASAEYSLLISADDVLAPEALVRATQLMDCHRDVGMTYGMALIITDDSGLNVTTETASDDYRIVSSSQFLHYCYACGNPVPTPTAVVRTELQHHLGGYRADLPHTGDMEMWMRFAVHASVGVLRAVQGYYRWHNSNMSSQYYANLLSDWREQVQACREVFTRWGTGFPELGLWLESMSQRLGEGAFWKGSEAFDEGDVDACYTSLEFAKEVYPDLCRSAIWWRFQAKRFLGQALWQRIRPAVNHFRGIRETLSRPQLKLPLYRSGQQIGWWPRPA